MNLRCIYCQTPFTLARVEMLNAIITMNEKSQNHYDAHCPRCRRANSISRQRMELFYPNWQDAAKQQAAMPKENSPASARLKTEPLPKGAKIAPAKKGKPAAKPAAKAAKKPAAKKAPAKAAPKKTVAKKSVKKK